uniref:SFRICE_039860 n=1 Tax=Spodoptera frugiperda TaxID=7108 RepID=A0A2H1WWW1_SPOFR
MTVFWWSKWRSGEMLVRGCVGGELRHSLAERTKALAAQCHALRSPARADRSCERRRTRHRKSQTRWYVKSVSESSYLVRLQASLAMQVKA